MVSEAIATGSMGAINYLVAEKYVKALDNLARSPNQKVLLLPTEMAGLGGVLAGIAEIARSATGPAPEQSATRPAAKARAQAKEPGVTFEDGPDGGVIVRQAGPWGDAKG